jgi:hypothetical protein
MKFENPFTPDELGAEKENLISKLKSEGMTETIRNEIIEWRKKREEQAMTTFMPNEIVRLNFEMSELYEACGDIDGMFQSLDDALFNADQEELIDTAEMISDKIREMEKKYPDF